MSQRNLIYAGSALLIGGLFAPVLTVPLAGALNLFGGGTNEVALILVSLAALTAILAANGREKDSIYPALAAAGLLIYVFARMEYGLIEMRRAVADVAKDNPFGGLAQGMTGAVHLQWGWLLLAAATGLLLVASFRVRREETIARIAPDDANARIILGISVVLLALVPASDLYAYVKAKPAPSAGDAAASTTADATAATASPTETSNPSPEEAAYIKDHLHVYDLTASYHDSMLDGRVPGVDFKIKNDGDRTLSEVDVRVVFYDKEGKAISEETYYPVLKSDFDDKGPLRPNYIWQQESDKFYEAKNVPSEWAVGKASASITKIEFAPNG